MTKHYDIIGQDDARRIIGGDDKQLFFSVPNMPAGVSLSEAWLTAKVSYADDDPGLFQKIVTTTDQPGIGQIVDAGGTTHIGSVRFDLNRDDTAALVVPDPLYGVVNNVYDMQVLTVGGQLETSVDGEICAFKGVTRAS